MCCVDYSVFGAQRRTFGVGHNSIEEGEVEGEGESTGKNPVITPDPGTLVGQVDQDRIRCFCGYRYEGKGKEGRSPVQKPPEGSA